MSKIADKTQDKTRHKRPESALVVVHTDSHVLLIKRADHESFWQSITGSLEWGEAPYQAALRELEEETGIAVEKLRTTGISRTYEIIAQWRHRYAPGVTRNREHVFYCKLAQQQPITLQPKEHQEYCWLPIDQAINRAWSWTNKLAIMALKAD